RQPLRRAIDAERAIVSARLIGEPLLTGAAAAASFRASGARCRHAREVLARFALRGAVDAVDSVVPARRVARPGHARVARAASARARRGVASAVGVAAAALVVRRPVARGASLGAWVRATAVARYDVRVAGEPAVTGALRAPDARQEEEKND